MVARLGMERRMKAKRAHLSGAVPGNQSCAFHGRYPGSVLRIGDSQYPSRCPRCREDDEQEERADLAREVIELLGGLAAMAKRKKRKDADRDFFVELIDVFGNARKIAVGNF